MMRPGYRIVRFRNKTSIKPRHKFLKDLLCGGSEFDYHCKLFSKLWQGNLLDTLTIEAQSDLSRWIEKEGLLDGTPFTVMFNFGDGDLRHAALYCSLTMDFEGVEPKMRILEALPGASDNMPKIMPQKRFEIFLCDLDIA